MSIARILIAGAVLLYLALLGDNLFEPSRTYPRTTFYPDPHHPAVVVKFDPR